MPLKAARVNASDRDGWAWFSLLLTQASRQGDSSEISRECEEEAAIKSTVRLTEQTGF